MNLRDEMWESVMPIDGSTTIGSIIEACAEVAERHLTDLRFQVEMGRALVAEKDARIAELEEERDSWRAKWYDAQRARMAAPLSRPNLAEAWADRVQQIIASPEESEPTDGN